MASRAWNVLFLCTGNSARSILAEALLNALGEGRFRAYSAGSHPAGRVNPFAIGYLRERCFPVDGLRSKSWEEFAGTAVGAMDFVITVCDNAAGEICPVWPGYPMTAHWGVPDPAGVSGSDDARRVAFADAASALEARIRGLVALPLAALDPAAAQRAVRTLAETASSRNTA